ncbi:MAG: hypothetical protein J6R04_05780 [Clostridia bacterium]|nr:hypothetical protein [Clostridia bacterium]
MSENATATRPLPRIVLPKNAVAVVGHEFNMYYNNVIFCDNLDNYMVTCSISPNPDRKIFNKTNTLVLSDCFRTTPPAGSEGDYQVKLAVSDKVTAEVLASGSYTLHVIPDRIAEPKRIIFLGDSLTEEGIVTAEVARMSEGKLIPIGTRTRTITLDGVDYAVLHEGRASWSAYDYTSEKNCKDNRFSGEANKFYNPETNAFDFAYYMKQQGYDGVDVVYINLGTNGAWVADITCEAMDTILASIHAYDKNIKIIVSLIPLGSTQDGFALSTGLDPAGTFRYNAIALNQRYMKAYDGTMENVSVAELYFCLDEINDFPSKTIPLSARNPGTRAVSGDNVHPNLYGYLKLADVAYNNILYVLNH